MQSNNLDPYSVKNPIEIILVEDVDEAEIYLKKGYCPIECSFGTKSIVDDLKMDHHGSMSDLEGVAIRAYRDHYGHRAEDPRFLVTGTPDEDATFAIASLAAKIPHPKLANLFLETSIKKVWCQNYQHIAELINQADINPRSVNLLEDYWGRLIVFWRETSNLTIRDVSSFHAGVVRWRDILTSPQDKLIQIVPSAVEASLQVIRSAPCKEISKRVSVIDCSEWGFSYTYADEWHKGSPIILAFYGTTDGKGHVTLSAKNKSTAHRLFGEKGFLGIYDKISKNGFPGCGGREDIGGSARFSTLTWSDAIKLGEIVDSLIVNPKLKQTVEKKKEKTEKFKDE